MKTLTMAVVVAGTLAGAALSAALPASAREAFSFSFDPGAVAFAYSDGYWDRDHKWRDARECRARYRDNYDHRRHTSRRNNGWRDSDHDGVPNRDDAAPHNPNRD